MSAFVFFFPPFVLREKKVNPFTITIAIPKAANIASPHLPVLNTNPFPLAATQRLSKLLGRTYIANSPLRLFSSTNSDRPEAAPRIQKDIFETRRLITHCGRCLNGEVKKFEESTPERRSVRNLCRLCLEQKMARDQCRMLIRLSHSLCEHSTERN